MPRIPPSEHARLLDLLDDNGTEDPNVVAILRSRDPLASLQVAGLHAGAGRYAEARALIRDAVGEDPDSAVVRIAAGILAYVCRDHAQAIEWLVEAADLDPHRAVTALRIALARARRLGWNADLRAILARLAELDAGQVDWHVQAERLFINAGDFERALAEICAATDADPERPTLWMERATIASKAPIRDEGRPVAHRADAVLSAVETALARARDAETPILPYYIEGANCLARAGALADSDRLITTAATEFPEDPRPVLELAERALWRMQTAEAASLARRAAALARKSSARTARDSVSAIRRILGAVEVLAGNYEQALQHLGEPDRRGGTEFGIDTSVTATDYRLHLWRAEALVHMDERPEAHRALTAAMMGAEAYLPSAWVLRVLLALRDGLGLGEYRDGEVRGFATTVEQVAMGRGAEADAIFASGDGDALTELLEGTLRHSGGNRSCWPTVLVDGNLVALPPVEGERQASRNALLRLRGGDWRESAAEFDKVAARYPGYALPEAHRGELFLWVGMADRCREALERAVAMVSHTRWAYIGLAGAALLEGNPELALRETQRGLDVMTTTGPAVYAYRGEAYMQLGRLDDAISELEEGVRLSPARFGSHVTLAVAKFRRGDDDESTAAADRMLLDWAPGLFSDAAREVGVSLWDEEGRLPDRETMGRVLEHALVMLRGNRGSSLYSYFTADDRLRFVPPREDDHGRPRAAHSGDRDDVQVARLFVKDAAGLELQRATVRGTPSARAGTRGPLGPDDIQHFLEHGYVKVEGAIPRRITDRWVARATAKIREEPVGYVCGLEPGPDAAAEFAGFDPADPTTWKRERIDVSGDGHRPWPELAPRLWEAVGQLVGGTERITSREFGEYLILNLGIGADSDPSDGAELWAYWHMDDPKPDARLDNITAGLLVVCLFSDVAADGGATRIAPGSVPRVARYLAAHPEGTDFVGDDAAAEIMRGCDEHVALTGRAGDAYLLHPFMLHTVAPNRLGRIRWMSNPIIHLDAPMDFTGDGAASPVEEAVVRALGSRLVEGRIGH